MQTMKVCLATLFVGLALTGTWVLTSKPQAVEAAPPLPKGDYWRNHDGHWCLWHEADKRWYYTDGSHWFYHDGKGWATYRFDKKFGHDFIPGEYKVPEGKRIVVPTHKVFHH